MGRQDIGDEVTDRQLRLFSRALLDDLRALERMCDSGMIESGVSRVGAEQEMFLVDSQWRPARLAMEVLRRLDDPRFTTELAVFNMEFNLPPAGLHGDCLGELEAGIAEALAKARGAARELGGDVLITGILPTIELGDLTMDNLTPLPRYFELNRVMTELSGGQFRTHIAGLDELHVTHESVMLEACNTSFQLHFQVSAGDFARLYNVAQLIAAPVLASAANSAALLQHRLWRETRVALFEQSLDIRSQQQKMRGSRRRVSFGDRWVDNSVVDLYRDQIARFRVLLAADPGEPSTDILDRGEVPPLKALCLHNGTVYRWNRPCYGIHNGKPHLRIENRAMPSGPTVLDEVANAAFYFGLLAHFSHQYDDLREHFSFDDAKGNFLAAARYGLKSNFRWENGQVVSATGLILDQLLPMAEAGLRRQGINEQHVERYLQVIEDRVATGQTGAQWTLDSLERLQGIRSRTTRYQTLTRVMAERQDTGEPVHRWALAEHEEPRDWRDQFRTVAQVMTTDLYTVHPEDLVDVAASVMHWEHVRYVPVEDNDGNLVGLLSHRSLLRMFVEGVGANTGHPIAVREIMKTDPVTVTPDTRCIEAIRLMRTHLVACLPVVQDGKLVGLVSERDFLEMAGKLFEEQLLQGRELDGNTST